MTDRPHISAILTAHREGLLVGPAAHSALAAIGRAEAAGLKCETIAVLDRADGVTRDVLHAILGDRARYIFTDEGDPGQARNRATELARGRFSTFLDGDDLWSENWLVAAYAQAVQRPDSIHHSACNLVFGDKRLLFWHLDSEAELCDISYLDWLNYWDAMSFAETELFRNFPFKANDIKAGYGHEDWHWNALTISEGIAHKPVPGTMHFKRARAGSQMGKVESVGGFRWPLGKGELLSTVRRQQA